MTHMAVKCIIPAVESQLEYPVHMQPLIGPFLSLIPYKSHRSDQSDA